MNEEMISRFSLKDRVVVITGGAGLLGTKHGEAVAEAGGIPVLLDIQRESVENAAARIGLLHGVSVLGLVCDITSKPQVAKCLDQILAAYGRIDALVNNAAIDPKVGPGADARRLTRFENMSLEYWNTDLSVSLTGAFLCSQVFGHHMATRGQGVIVNVASDLAVIAPDQRLYRQPDLPADAQPVKPVTYSVAKAGLVGLTRYLATY